MGDSDNRMPKTRNKKHEISQNSTRMVEMWFISNKILGAFGLNSHNSNFGLMNIFSRSVKFDGDFEIKILGYIQ